MAAAVVCECCGEVKAIKDTVHVRVHQMTCATEFRCSPEDYFDVCKECYKKIEQMLAHKENKK